METFIQNSPNQTHVLNSVEQAEEYESSKEAFGNELQALRGVLPEVDRHAEGIEAAGKELITNFGIRASLFQDKGAGVIFTALAYRLAENAKKPDTEQRQEEEDYIFDSVTLLTHKHADGFSEIVRELDSDSPEDLAHRTTVFEKYTDPKLSQEIKAAIDDGLLDDVKQNMGVTAASEDPFEVRVLTIDPGYDSNGFRGPQVNFADLFTSTDPEKDRLAAEAIEIGNDIYAYKNGLTQRAEAMDEELGPAFGINNAFVTHLDGKTPTLCITMPMAEKLLYPELTENNPDYTEDDAESDRMLLGHEYVHTQGGLIFNNDPTIGINFEELRAEHFSGNKHGYMDIKGFFTDVQAVTDYDARAFLEAHPKGGTRKELCIGLAEYFGLATSIDILMAVPHPYVEQGNIFVKSVDRHTGSYDGITGRLLEEQVAAGHVEEIEQRIDKIARNFLNAGSNAEFVVNYRKGQGLNIVTDLARDRMRHMAKQ